MSKSKRTVIICSIDDHADGHISILFGPIPTPSNIDRLTAQVEHWLAIETGATGLLTKEEVRKRLIYIAHKYNES